MAEIECPKCKYIYNDVDYDECPCCKVLEENDGWKEDDWNDEEYNKDVFIGDNEEDEEEKI